MCPSEVVPPNGRPIKDFCVVKSGAFLQHITKSKAIEFVSHVQKRCTWIFTANLALW